MKLSKNDLLKTIDGKSFINEFLSIITEWDIKQNSIYEITFIKRLEQFYISGVKSYSPYNSYTACIGSNIDFENISSIKIEASSDTQDNIMDFEKSMLCLQLLQKYFLD